jgi:hypothetical protein
MTWPPWAVQHCSGRAKANGREPKSCLGRVFNFKLGCFDMWSIAWYRQGRPDLELKTWLRCCPVNLTGQIGSSSNRFGAMLSQFYWLALQARGSQSVACTIKVL